MDEVRLDQQTHTSEWFSGTRLWDPAWLLSSGVAQNQTNDQRDRINGITLFDVWVENTVTELTAYNNLYLFFFLSQIKKISYLLFTILNHYKKNDSKHTTINHSDVIWSWLSKQIFSRKDMSTCFATTNSFHDKQSHHTCVIHALHERTAWHLNLCLDDRQN